MTISFIYIFNSIFFFKLVKNIALVLMYLMFILSSKNQPQENKFKLLPHFRDTIQITPSFQGSLFILIFVDDFAGEEASLYGDITVYYWRYASSYGNVFLGVAVILISYYGYRRYKWR